MHDMFVRDVVIIAHDGNRLHVIVSKPVILLTSHAVVQRILIHDRADRITVSQIKREKALLIEELRERNSVRTFCMKVLGCFTLNKRGLRLFLEYGVLGQLVCLAQVLEGRNKRTIGSESFVPPAKLRGKLRRYLDLVDGREETDPWIPRGKRARILGEELREIRVLKVLQPIGNAEVAEIRNRRDAQIVKRIKCLISKGPVVLAGTEVRRIIGWTISQKLNIEFFYKRKIVTPVLIVTTLFHLIDALRFSVRQRNRRIAILDTRGEHELPRLKRSQRRHSLPFSLLVPHFPCPRLSRRLLKPTMAAIARPAARAGL